VHLLQRELAAHGRIRERLDLDAMLAPQLVDPFQRRQRRVTVEDYRRDAAEPTHHTPHSGIVHLPLLVLDQSHASLVPAPDAARHTWTSAVRPVLALYSRGTRSRNSGTASWWTSEMVQPPKSAPPSRDPATPGTSPSTPTSTSISGVDTS